MDELALVGRIAAVLDEKKGEDIVLIDLREISIPTSYFVVASADNPVHVKALVSALREGLPMKPLQGEGLAERRWVVLDYGGVVVHLFRREAREFYDIESLWADHLMELPRIDGAPQASKAPGDV
jgi:ribosome-associated protein